jgi:hypothetical protein
MLKRLALLDLSERILKILPVAHSYLASVGIAIAIFPFLWPTSIFGIAFLRVSIKHNPEKHSLGEEPLGLPKVRPRTHLGPLGEDLEPLEFKSMLYGNKFGCVF